MNVAELDSEESLAGALSRLGSRRVLVVTGESGRHLERVQAALGGLEVAVFAGARRHVPAELLAEARARLDACGADTVVALGGGSAIGFGKALRLERDVKLVAMPTTYAGSEMTTLWGITSAGRKTTGRDPRVRPDAVVHDVDLTLDMPKRLTVTSLMNALAHPIAVLGTGSVAGRARAEALDAVAIVYGAIEALVRTPGDRRARAEALRGAGAAAAALEKGTSGLHHKLAHRLGGRFDLDHAGLHSVLLPHSVGRLRQESPALVAELSVQLGVTDLEGSLFDFLIRGGASTSLRALGVESVRLEELLEAEPELPRDLLWAALHGRRPSVAVRLEDWGLPQPVSVRGPAPEDARRVVLAIHGSDATADGILGRAVELVGNDPTVCVLAPQATDNVWCAGGDDLPRAQIGASLEVALRDLDLLLAAILVRSAPERVALFGFSQGAGLAIELLIRRNQRFGGLVALSGAGIGAQDEQPPAGAGVAGVSVLLGASAGDRSVSRARIDGVAARLRGAGALVSIAMVPGDAHDLHATQRIRARAILRGVAEPEGAGGFGNFHESETLPGALPRQQSSPRQVPYGLYAEQVNATGFVAPRAENQRSWLYRIRPSAEQGPSQPLVHPTLAGDFDAAPAEANLAAWAPLPLPVGPTDFVDGLATLGGAGSPRLRRGYALHVYAANRGMEERCFANADGDLVLLPEHGALTVLTELGILAVAPGQIAVLPRGIRFSVLLDDGVARGYLAESFGRPFHLAERGPLGANSLADARHFRGPAAWHEDRMSIGYRVTFKLGGTLHQATQDHSPFDVVAWHGNLAPSVYDLDAFSPAGNTRVDHGDPSIHTVLSAPLDELGAHTLDLVVFTPRWDPTEHTFRPPYFHRNVTTELNGIIREAPAPGSPFVPGCAFVTPSLVPHGVMAASVARHLALADDAADRPRRSDSSSLWFQLETALPFCPTPWAVAAPHRIREWPYVWGAFRRRFRDPV